MIITSEAVVRVLIAFYKVSPKLMSLLRQMLWLYLVLFEMEVMACCDREINFSLSLTFVLHLHLFKVQTNSLHWEDCFQRVD